MPSQPQPLARRFRRSLRAAGRLGRAAIVGAWEGVALERRTDPRTRRVTMVGTDGNVHRLGHGPRPQVPECPPGWSIGPPDFVIVGAEKSGTSRWLKLLRDHPDVHVARGVREIHFWDDFTDRWPTTEDIERYHRFFPRPPGKLSGEKTPQYMSLWWAPRMLALAAPDARIIVLLRDPVERYVSGRTQLEKYRPQGGQESGILAFERRAVELAMHRSEYALQLDWLRHAFPAEQILVLQYEACNDDPQAQLDRTVDHLGLPRFTPTDDLRERPINASWLERVPIEDERRQLLVELYRPEVLRLKAMVPELDLSLWPNYADLAG